MYYETITWGVQKMYIKINLQVSFRKLLEVPSYTWGRSHTFMWSMDSCLILWLQTPLSQPNTLLWKVCTIPMSHGTIRSSVFSQVLSHAMYRPTKFFIFSFFLPLYIIVCSSQFPLWLALDFIPSLRRGWIPPMCFHDIRCFACDITYS